MLHVDSLSRPVYACCQSVSQSLRPALRHAELQTPACRIPPWHKHRGLLLQEMSDRHPPAACSLHVLSRRSVPDEPAGPVLPLRLCCMARVHRLFYPCELSDCRRLLSAVPLAFGNICWQWGCATAVTAHQQLRCPEPGGQLLGAPAGPWTGDRASRLLKAKHTLGCRRSLRACSRSATQQLTTMRLAAGPWRPACAIRRAGALSPRRPRPSTVCCQACCAGTACPATCDAAGLLMMWSELACPNVQNRGSQTAPSMQPASRWSLTGRPALQQRTTCTARGQWGWATPELFHWGGWGGSTQRTML